MLILTRRAGESLIIGDEVNVTVLGIKGGQVRLGIEAPRDIAIHREEIVARDAAIQAADSTNGPAEEDARAKPDAAVKREEGTGDSDG